MSLLTITQQNSIKPISGNNTKYYNQIAVEVEQVELMDLLGIALFQDVRDNPDTTKNAVLLNGGSFEDCDGNTIKFKGLRYILAYMNYSRYIGTVPFKDTYTGFVVKNRPESNTIDEGTAARLQRENRKIALREWLVTKEFLNENCEDYPLWNSTKTKKPYNPKFTTLRKTAK